MSRGGSAAGAWLLAGAVFAFFLSVIGMGSVIARYTRELGVGVDVVGMVFSMAPLTAALLRLPVGVAADVVGSGKLMALGGVLAALASLYASTAASIEALLIARAVQGAALAAFIGPSLAAASRLPNPLRAISLRSAAVSSANIVSPALAGLLVDLQGYTAAFAYTGAAGLAAAGLSALLAAREPPAAGGSRRGWSLGESIEGARRVYPILAISLLDGITFFAFQSIPQSHLRDLGYPASTYGLAATLNGLAGLVARLSSPLAAEHIGAPRTMAAGYAAATASMLLLSAYPEPPGVYLAAALYGAGLGLSLPSEQYTLMNSVSPRIRNTVASVYAVAFDAGGVVGTNLFGAVAEATGYTTAYTLMAVPEAASLAIALTLVPGLARRQAPGAPRRERAPTHSS